MPEANRTEVKSMHKVDPDQVCAYLGLADDPATHYGFPNTLNYCHANSQPQDLSIGVQATQCLGRQWVTCPRFIAAQKAHGRSRHMPPSIPQAKNRGWLKWALAGAVTVLVILVIGWVLFQLPDEVGSPPAMPVVAVTHQPTATAQVVLAQPSAAASATPPPQAAPTEATNIISTALPTRIAPTATETTRPAPTTLAVNVIARVTLPQDSVLNLRDKASTTGKVLAQLKNNALVTLIDGPVDANGLRWWKLDDNNGTTGWSVEKQNANVYLVPVKWAK